MFNKIITGMAKGLVTLTNDYNIVEARELATLERAKVQLTGAQNEITDLKKVHEELDTNFDSQISQRYATIVELEDKLRKVTDERDTARDNIRNLIEDIKTATRVPKKLREDIESKYETK